MLESTLLYHIIHPCKLGLHLGTLCQSPILIPALIATIHHHSLYKYILISIFIINPEFHPRPLKYHPKTTTIVSVHAQIAHKLLIIPSIVRTTTILIQYSNQTPQITQLTPLHISWPVYCQHRLLLFTTTTRPSPSHSSSFPNFFLFLYTSPKLLSSHFYLSIPLSSSYLPYYLVLTARFQWVGARRIRFSMGGSVPER